MKTQAELNELEVYIDYDDNLSIVEGFLKLSAFNRMAEFDFELAFSHLNNPIWYKLVEHGQACSFGDFKEYMHEFMWIEVDFTPFTVSTDYIMIHEDEVKDAIAELHYHKFRSEFEGHFEDLVDIHESMRLATNDESEMEANVILFDRVIHAEHVTGDIFDDLDIDQIKHNLDEEIIEMMGIELEIV